MQQYSPLLAENGFTLLESIAALDKDTLVTMGITLMGYQAIILQKKKALEGTL
jgi:hypothetical protein